LFNTRSIKLYTTGYDVLWCSVATSFHSTLKFNTLCKYIQTTSIHHRELIYVERNRRTAQLQTAIPDTCEMSVDSPHVHLLLKMMI